MSNQQRTREARFQRFIHLRSILFEWKRCLSARTPTGSGLPGWVLGGKYVNAFSLQEVPLDPDFLCLSRIIGKERERGVRSCPTCELASSLKIGGGQRLAADEVCFESFFGQFSEEKPTQPPCPLRVFFFFFNWHCNNTKLTWF